MPFKLSTKLIKVRVGEARAHSPACKQSALKSTSARRTSWVRTCMYRSSHRMVTVPLSTEMTAAGPRYPLSSLDRGGL